MLEILGWILLALAAFIALSLTYRAAEKLRSKESVMRATLYQGVFLWMVVIFLLLVPSVNKLHLIWIVPVCFPLIGYLTFAFSKKE